MNIEIKCFASLSRHAPPAGWLEMPAGSRVENVVAELGINNEELKIIFINGVHADVNSTLNDGDRLGLIPAVGGG